MKFLIPYIIMVLLLASCVPQKNILKPIDNNELKLRSDSLIYTNIPIEQHRNIEFIDALSGFQCNPKVEDLDVFSENMDISEYESFKCTCYNYELRTEQKQRLYIGTKTMSYLWSSVCYDAENKIVEVPKKDRLILATSHLNKKYILLEEVDSLTSEYLDEKTKFGSWPKLIYRVEEDKVFWEVVRYKGRRNVSVYEFKIDAINGNVVQMKKLPYRRTFWQWLSGMKH